MITKELVATPEDISRCLKRLEERDLVQSIGTELYLPRRNVVEAVADLLKLLSKGPT